MLKLCTAGNALLECKAYNLRFRVIMLSFYKCKGIAPYFPSFVQRETLIVNSCLLYGLKKPLQMGISIKEREAFSSFRALMHKSEAKLKITKLLAPLMRTLSP